jgi:hypothetical protein
MHDAEVVKRRWVAVLRSRSLQARDCFSILLLPPDGRLQDRRGPPPTQWWRPSLTTLGRVHGLGLPPAPETERGRCHVYCRITLTRYTTPPGLPTRVGGHSARRTVGVGACARVLRCCGRATRPTGGRGRHAHVGSRDPARRVCCCSLCRQSALQTFRRRPRARRW